MTKARFLKADTLEELRTSIEKNLSSYRTGNFDFLQKDSTLWFEHELEINEEKLSSMKLSSGPDNFEVENCSIIYDSLQELTPYEARDERLWVYLTHTLLLSYVRRRWNIPLNDEEAIKHIHKHFFARDKRQVERDNAASRLWWMAHLCARVQSIDQKAALEAFLFRSDVRANLIERPTTSQCTELFGAVLRKLMASYAGGKALFERAVFRKLMSEINSVGGFKLLDCLSEAQAEKVVDDIVTKRLLLTSL